MRNFAFFCPRVSCYCVHDWFRHSCSWIKHFFFFQTFLLCIDFSFNNLVLSSWRRISLGLDGFNFQDAPNKTVAFHCTVSSILCRGGIRCGFREKQHTENYTRVYNFGAVDSEELNRGMLQGRCSFSVHGQSVGFEGRKGGRKREIFFFDVVLNCFCFFFLT